MSEDHNQAANPPLADAIGSADWKYSTSRGVNIWTMEARRGLKFTVTQHADNIQAYATTGEAHKFTSTLGIYATVAEARQRCVELRDADGPRLKIVCICGSTRFVDVMAVKAWEFEKHGILTLNPHLLPQWYEGVKEHHQAEAEGVAHILDELHLRKIDLADEVFVVNRGGYIGDRTRIEIDYALSHGKPVRYMEQNK